MQQQSIILFENVMKSLTASYLYPISRDPVASLFHITTVIHLSISIRFESITEAKQMKFYKFQMLFFNRFVHQNLRWHSFNKYLKYFMHFYLTTNGDFPSFNLLLGSTVKIFGFVSIIALNAVNEKLNGIRHFQFKEIWLWSWHCEIMKWNYLSG